MPSCYSPPQEPANGDPASSLPPTPPRTGTFARRCWSVDPDAFASSAEEHRATTVEETAARIGFDPANNFIVGAFAGR